MNFILMIISFKDVYHVIHSQQKESYTLIIIRKRKKLLFIFTPPIRVARPLPVIPAGARAAPEPVEPAPVPDDDLPPEDL
jgi:hypothetical protein